MFEPEAVAADIMCEVARLTINPWVLVVLVVIGVSLLRPLIERACADGKDSCCTVECSTASNDCCCAGESGDREPGEEGDDRPTGGCECPKRACTHGPTAVAPGMVEEERLIVPDARLERVADRIWTPRDAACDLLRPPRA